MATKSRVALVAAAWCFIRHVVPIAEVRENARPKSPYLPGEWIACTRFNLLFCDMNEWWYDDSDGCFKVRTWHLLRTRYRIVRESGNDV